MTTMQKTVAGWLALNLLLTSFLFLNHCHFTEKSVHHSAELVALSQIGEHMGHHQWLVMLTPTGIKADTQFFASLWLAILLSPQSVTILPATPPPR